LKISKALQRCSTKRQIEASYLVGSTNWIDYTAQTRHFWLLVIAMG